MRPLQRSLLVPALTVGLVTAGLAAADTAAQQAVTVSLSAQNNSGISGTATLTPMGEQTQVVLQLQNAPGPHPAHIHDGTCANLNPAPKYPLQTVMNGRSETTVNVGLQQLLAGQAAINVHRSPQEASVYVACGDLTAAAAPPGTLPRAGEAENRGIAALAMLGLALLGAGLAFRQRRA
jgi:LPXTG-motif cell wall-anchored protein